MDVSINSQYRRYLDRKVKSGEFKSPGDVIGFALERLRKDEKDLAWLSAEIDKGLASADRGDLVEWDLETTKARLLRSVARRQRRKS